MLRSYAEVQMMLKNYAEELYPIYEDGQHEEFSTQIELVTRSLNGGLITKKQKAKTHSLIRSLNMLSSLDEEHCKYMVNKFLAKDEFIELDGTTKVLTF